MITLKEWLEIIDYRVIEGGTFMWDCFGPHAYQLSSWEYPDDNFSTGIVFDTITQEVYMVEVCDYINERAYRLITPAHRDSFLQYSMNRIGDASYAWDNVEFTDLEVVSDWKEKAIAIWNKQDYDTRVVISVDMPQDLIIRLYELAHAADITVNKFVEQILQEEFEKINKE